MLHLLGKGKQKWKYEDIHDPEKVFAFMCYRGVHYAKWVYLNIFIEGSSWNLNNPRKDDTRTNT